MKHLFAAIKGEFARTTAAIQLIAGFILAVAGASTLAANIFHSQICVGLIAAGLFFIVNRVCSGIIAAKKDSFGIETPLYHQKTITAAKITKIISYSLWAAPVWVIISSLALKNKACEPSDNLGLVITSFSDSKDDDFSYKLFDRIQSELQNTDTVTVFRTSKYINIGTKSYIDTIKQTLENNCVNHGLVIFGKRNLESKLFECNIFIEIEKIAGRQRQEKNKRIIYLQNPDLINFSIESQADVVSEFILGLLYLNSNDINISIDKLNKALKVNGNKDNKKFMSYCHLFIGGSYFTAGRFTEAIEEYKKGVAVDSTNSYLHYNLGSSFLAASDSNSASSEFKIAWKLNTRLENPIAGYTGLAAPINKTSAAAHIPSGLNTVSKEKDDNHSRSQTSGISTEPDLHLIRENRLYGLANKKDQIVVPCQYDSIYLKEYIYKGREYIIAQKDAKFGALDTHGKIVIPFAHSAAERVMTAIRILADNKPDEDLNF